LLVVFLLFYSKAQRVADDMRALMVKMKALQGKLDQVTIKLSCM